MRGLRISVLLMLAMLCGTAALRADDAGRTNAPALMPADAPVVFFRNYKNPTDSRYRVLPEKYRLGKASVIPPSAAWIELAKKIGIKEDVSEFPLLFARPLRSKSGKEFLVVVQLGHAFNGDGFWGPGPNILLRFTTLDLTDPKAPKMVWTGGDALGDMQHSCIFAGEPDPQNASGFVVKMETLNAAETGSSFTWLKAQVRDDGSLEGTVPFPWEHRIRGK